MVQSLYKRLCPGLKNHMRILDNFKQAVESPKSWNLMGCFCPKNTFLQLKHRQRIYPTLLSITSVKIHQMISVIFKTMCHFSRHSPSINFISIILSFTIFYLITYFLQKQRISDLPLLALKFTKFLMTFLEPRVSFSSNFASLFSFMRLNLRTFFHVNLYMLWTKGSYQSANF